MARWNSSCPTPASPEGGKTPRFVAHWFRPDSRPAVPVPGESSAGLLRRCRATSSDLLLRAGPCRKPVERSHPPEINQGGDQHPNEDEHFRITGPAQLAAGNGPKKYENGFQVENDEEHGHQVKLDRQAHLRRTFRSNARFVLHAGRAFIMPLSQHVGKSKHSHHYEDHQREVYGQWPNGHLQVSLMPVATGRAMVSRKALSSNASTSCLTS